jgi:manganese efflux pump family protein
MNIMEIIWIAVGLSMDAFAVAVACSIAITSVTHRHVFRMAFHFGFFQGMMPVLGWSVGIAARKYIQEWDHWIAFGLLAFIGGKAIIDALGKKSCKMKQGDPTKGLTIIIFSVATSIDALAAGISLAAINVNIFLPAMIIGAITFLMTTLGMILGKKIGCRYSRDIEVAGGVILIGIGLKILLFHTVFA